MTIGQMISVWFLLSLSGMFGQEPVPNRFTQYILKSSNALWTGAVGILAEAKHDSSEEQEVGQQKDSWQQLLVSSIIFFNIIAVGLWFVGRLWRSRKASPDNTLNRE
jgi:hypothetical protein